MPRAFDRCVQHVKGKVKNPYAVCRASMGSDEDIKKREQARKGRKKRA